VSFNYGLLKDESHIIFYMNHLSDYSTCNIMKDIWKFGNVSTIGLGNQ